MKLRRNSVLHQKGTRRQHSDQRQPAEIRDRDKQKSFPQPICSVRHPPGESKSHNLSISTDQIYQNFKDLFNRIGKVSIDQKVNHSHSSCIPVHSRGRSVPLRLISVVNEEVPRVETEGRIKKLVKCDEDCFISPIIVTRKKHGSIKLALDSE